MAVLPRPLSSSWDASASGSPIALGSRGARPLLRLGTTVLVPSWHQKHLPLRPQGEWTEQELWSSHVAPGGCRAHAVPLRDTIRSGWGNPVQEPRPPVCLSGQGQGPTPHPHSPLRGMRSPSQGNGPPGKQAPPMGSLTAECPPTVTVTDFIPTRLSSPPGVGDFSML